MSLSYVLRGALNICKMRPVSIISKYPAMSSIACQNIYNITSEKRNLADVKKFQIEPLKLTQAVKREFSTTPAKLSHDHAKLWVTERYVSAGLLGIVPLSVMFPNMLFDILMSVSVVMHMHWGFEAIAVDYIRPIIFGSVIPKIAVWAVYLLSIFTLAGLLNLTFNNVGLGNSIRLLWRV